MSTPPIRKVGKQNANRNKASPFRLVCPPEAAEPKNPECLGEAVKLLRPFQYQTDAEALAAGAEFVDGKTRFPISAESAQRLLTKTASSFNSATYFHERAPRLADVERELSALSQAAKAMSSTMRMLNDVTLHHLRHREDIVLFHGENVISDMDIALTNELPRPANETSLPELYSWHDRLAALSRHAEFTKRRFQQQREKQGRSAKDRGGKTNMLKESVGSPKWGLVLACLVVFDAFKPDQATGYNEGDFHRFVSEVFEFATGKESSKAAIDDLVKELVPAYRDRKQIENEINDIHVCMHKLESERDTAAGREQWLALMQRLDALHHREELLAQRLWPHVRLSKLPIPASSTASV